MHCPVLGQTCHRHRQTVRDHNVFAAEPRRRALLPSRSCHLQRLQTAAAQKHARPCRCAAAAVAEGEAASKESPAVMGQQEKAVWHAVIANSDFMLHDVQNESFAEQLRERRRMFGEQDRSIDFFLVPEPEWLDSKFPDQAKRVGRPSLAVVSPDKTWITFMKLRLDRVLKLELGEMTTQEATKSVGSIPNYGPLDKATKWTAPYSPYRPGWWEAFMAKQE